MSHLTERVIDAYSTPADAGAVDPREGDARSAAATGPERDGGAGAPLGWKASPWGIFAGCAAAAGLVALSPAVNSHSFTPKYVVLLMVAAVGFVPFVDSLRRGRSAWVSWAAVGFLVVGLISALTSAAPSIGILGLYEWGTGWLVWLAAAGAFGIGLRLSSYDLNWLTGGIVVGAVANSLLSLYQTLAVPTSAAFGPYQNNQADGFMGNPVHLEALLLGAIAIVSIRAVRSWRSLARWAPVLMLMAVALEFSTERLGLPVLGLILVVAVVVGRWRGLVVAVPTVAGYAIGWAGGKTDLGHRIAQGTSSPGFHLRYDVWRAGLHAVAHHLLIGSGPGEFEAGTAPLIGRHFAVLLGPTKLFSDAHDIVIEVLVTTGVLGAVLLATWIGGSLLRARNPLVLFALAVFGVELVEPLNIVLTWLAFLALGAASVRTAGSAKAETLESAGPALIKPVGRLATTVLVGAALFLGGTMVAGDVALAHSPPSLYENTEATSANRLLPYWPESAMSVARLHQYLAATSTDQAAKRAEIAASLPWWRAAASRAPFDPSGWTSLGDAEGYLGRYSVAISDYELALHKDPSYAFAFQGLGYVAAEQHRWSDAVRCWSTELTLLPAGPERVSVAQFVKAAHSHRLPGSTQSLG